MPVPRLRVVLSSVVTCVAVGLTCAPVHACDPGASQLSLSFVAPDGHPATDVCVELRRLDTDGGAGGCTEEASSDLTVEGLAPGRRYYLWISTPSQDFVDVYYPGTLRLGESTPVTAGTHLQVVMAPAAHVSGRLVSSTGHPVADAVVEADPVRPGPGEAYAQTDRSGRYRMKLLPGRYRVAFVAGSRGWQYVPGATDPRAATVFEARLGPDLRVDDVALGPLREEFASVGGRVVDPDGRPVAGVCVRWELPSPWAAAVRTHRAGPDTTCAGSVSRWDGRYRIASVPAGVPISVGAHDVTGGYASSRVDDLMFSDRQRVDDLDLTVTRAGAVSGVVSDLGSGRPLSGVCPEARDATGRVALEGRATCSDDQGRWRLEGLPPGTIVVRLYPGDPDHVAAFTPTAAHPWDATKLLVHSDEQTLAPASRLRLGATAAGVVRGPDGAPVPHALVSVGAWDLGRGTGPLGPAAFTDDAGRYEIAGVPPGSDVVQVVPPSGSGLAWAWVGGSGLASTAPRQRFSAGTTTTRDVVLRASAVLRVVLAQRPTPACVVTLDVIASDGSSVGEPVVIYADGHEAVLDDLPGGRYRLRARIWDPDQEFASPASWRTWWYPDTPSPSRATPADLAEGMTTTVVLAVR